MRSSNIMTCVSIERYPDPADSSTQQSKDVQDKLGDLIPWLVKLKDSVTTAGANGNHEEAKRREQLIRCVSRPRCLVDPC